MLIFILSSLVLLLGTLVFFIFRIDLGLNLADKSIEKFFTDNLICSKRSWKGFLNLSLTDCKNKKAFFKVKTLNYNLLTGHLFLDKPEITLVGKTEKTNKFPKIPSFLRSAEIHNLKINGLLHNLNLPNSLLTDDLEELKDQADLKLDFIKLNRQILNENAWNIETHNFKKKLQIAGLIGEKLDLKITTNKFAFAHNSLNGDFKVKNDNWQSLPFEIDFNSFKVKTPSLIQPIIIKGKVYFDNKFKALTNFQDFSLKNANLFIRSNDEVNKELLIDKFEIKNFLKNTNYELKDFKVLKGFAQGRILVNNQNNFKDSILKLQFADLQAESPKYNSKINNMRGEISLKPLQIKPRKPNLKSFEFLRDFGLIGLNLMSEFENKTNLKNQVLIKSQGKANIIFSEENSDFKTLIKLDNSEIWSKEIGKLPFSGIIQTNNNNLDFKLESSSNNSLLINSAPIVLNGNFSSWLGSQNGKIQIKTNKINLKPNLSIAKAKLQKIDLENLLLNLIVQNKKVTLTDGHLNIKNIQALLKTGKTINLQNGNLVINHQMVKLDNLNYQNKVFFKALMPANNLSQISVKQINWFCKGLISLDELTDLAKGFDEKLKLDPNKYKLIGIVNFALEGQGKNLKEVNLNLDQGQIYWNKELWLNDLNASVKLNKNKQLILDNLKADLKGQSRIHVRGILDLLKFRLNVLIHPKSLLTNYDKLNFADNIYIPIQINLNPNLKTHDLNFQFSSNLRKLQLNNGVIHFAQDLSLTKLIGNLKLNWINHDFVLTDLIYQGDEFGLILNAKGKPDNINLVLESAPLLDLAEIAKLWSNEYAGGAFRGKVIANGINLKNPKSWLKDLKLELYSEEDVHDIEYGILYGKHFQLYSEVKDGDGYLTLSTKKGKIKNLQITDLYSYLKIINGTTAQFEEASFKAAEGKASFRGEINLDNGKSDLAGSMKNVNIETITNNLFGNSGDYNGTGNLNYEMKGDFLNIIQTAHPDQANGSFALKDGFLKQTAELSKNLDLANLVFGGPLNFNLEALNRTVSPNEKLNGGFVSLNGDWNFDKENKTIQLTNTVYEGKNALLMSINGDWGFESKTLKFDVYGFMPKKPMILDSNSLEQSSLALNLAPKSRHFRFKVNGNMNNPSGLTNSVKRSIYFMDNWQTKEVKEKF